MLKLISYAALGLSCGAAWFGHHSWLWTLPALALCVVFFMADFDGDDLPAEAFTVHPPLDMDPSGFKFGAISTLAGPARLPISPWAEASPARAYDLRDLNWTRFR